MRTDGYIFGQIASFDDIAFGIRSTGVELGSAALAAWSSTANWYGTKDAALARNAAGVIEFNRGTSGSNIGHTVTAVSSGVNYIDISSAVTTASPTISAVGSDTNVGITFVLKGTGPIKIGTANGQLTASVNDWFWANTHLVSGFGVFLRGTRGTGIDSTAAAGDLQFMVGGATSEKARISTGGLFLLGTTSITTAQLNILSGATSRPAGLFRPNASEANNTTNIRSDNPAGTEKAGFKAGGTEFVTATATTATAGGTTTLDLATGNYQDVTMGAGNTTIAWSNIPNSSVVVITIIQDGVGSRTITAWPATAKFPGGTAPTLSTGAGKRDQIFFRCDGSNCFMQSISLDVR